MLLKRQGLPDEGELVFCTVTNVQYNSVFVKIELYDKTGLIHISEISPGRIRNIRDYVREGKMIVCKVIKVDESRGNIDLSLRRVTEMQKRKMTDERKQEQKAEKIIETLATQLEVKFPEAYKKISSALLKHYDYVHQAFEDVVENNASLLKQGVPKEYSAKLEELVREKIQPKQVIISGVISAKSYEDNGVEIVKESLTNASKAAKNVSIRYLGAGNYSLEVEAKDYKIAEKNLSLVLESAKKNIPDEKLTTISFKKKEKD